MTNPCKPAAQVTDVTVPDGTRLKPGEAFTKVWRFLNSGNCAWEKGWALVFQNGNKFGALDTVPVQSSDVTQSVQVSLTMKAPQSPGTYTGVWALQSSAGQIITITDVSIVVLLPAPTRAVTPGAPAPQSATRPAGGGIPPVGTGAFAVDQNAVGPTNCSCVSNDEWIGEFYVIVSGGPGNYTISDPENCQWDYNLSKFVCRYRSRFDGTVMKTLYVSCPGCKRQRVAVSGRAAITLSPRLPRWTQGGCGIPPNPTCPGGKKDD
jgi:hypothetical protein